VIVELSSKVEYALLALLELASHKKKGEPMKVSEIVQSQRGAKGGYLLAKEPWQITLLEVVSSVEGDSSPKNGDFSEATTLEKTAVLEVWLQVKKASFAALGGYTLQDLCQQRDAYRQENPMYYI
jgi:DNA-binding IscR family transcriptional regulator